MQHFQQCNTIQRKNRGNKTRNSEVIFRKILFGLVQLNGNKTNNEF